VARVGFHAPFLAALGGGEKVVLTLLAEAVRLGHDVTLLAPAGAPVAPAAWARLGVHVEPGSFAAVRADGHADVTARSARLDLLVALTNDVPPLARSARAVAIVQFPVRARDRPRERALAAALAVAGRRRAPAALASYDRFAVYSRFVRAHVRRRLGVDAVVVPPPVAPPAGPVAPLDARAPLVLAVGRFFRGAHAKRHDVLLAAFAALHRRLGAASPWRLALVGGVDPAARGDVAALRAAAAGLPVDVLTDASAAELAALQARAAFVWHAAGYAVDERRHPERCEHFGLAVVEGAAHAAVPLVVPAGGPAELVDDGADGVHWRCVPALAAATEALIAAPAERARLAAAAQARAAAYAPHAFLARARAELLEP